MADERSFTAQSGEDDLERLPEIAMFGDARHRTAEPRLGPHHNPGIEICLCRSGIYRWIVESSSVEIKPGELSITRPWQLHSGQNNVLGPGRLTWIIIAAVGRERLDAPALEPLLGEEASWITESISSSTRSFLGVVPEAPGLLDLIADELTSRRPGRIATIRAAVVRLLVVAVRRLGEMDEAGGQRTDRFLLRSSQF